MVNSNTRRTQAAPRTTRLSQSKGSSRMSLIAGQGKGGGRRMSDSSPEVPKIIAEQPSCVRFIELGTAMVLWIIVLALQLLLRNQLVATVLIVFIMISLLLHSQLLRPYCYEFDEDEEAFVGYDLHEDVGSNSVQQSSSEREVGNSGTASVHSAVSVPIRHGHTLLSTEFGQQFWEEWKLVVLCLIIMSSIGSVVCWNLGGSFAFQTWIAPELGQCSVADLEEKQRLSTPKFGCQDGFVDTSAQVSLMRKNGLMEPSYNVYRMAPVYTKHPKKGDSPAAWAVTKDRHLGAFEAARENGLSGIFVSVNEDPSACRSLLCISHGDQVAYMELRHLLQTVLKKDGAKELDAASLPAVVLTDLSNPIGKAWHFLYGAVCYLTVLFGLVCVTTSMVAEHRKFGLKKLEEEPQYDLLGEGESSP